MSFIPPYFFVEIDCGFPCFRFRRGEIVYSLTAIVVSPFTPPVVPHKFDFEG